MNLKTELAALKNGDLTFTERAEVSCRIAKQLEKVGEYEAACEALVDFWPEQDKAPRLDDLDQRARAEVLLRVGNLAGWLGSTDQTSGSQEKAKDLITRSIEDFSELVLDEKIAEARGDLALCYWREGSFDEARVQIRTALHLLRDDSDELRAVLLIRAGIIEERTRRFESALRFYNEAAPLVERSDDHALKGSFHFEYGHVLGWLAAPNNREDYLDRALIEYAASSFHYEQAGNVRALARVETNLGYLFFTIGRYGEAHEHLDRARYLFIKLKDRGTAAQVDDTRARTLLAEGHAAEAERVVRAAVKVLERGDHEAYLAELLTTHGVALARLGHHPRARVLLERAIEVAETTGDLEGAGRAKLSIIEELEEKIPTKELVSIYRSAIVLLKGSQDPSIGKRLISCAEKLLDTFDALESREQEPKEHTWEGFSLKGYVRDGERSVIERALRDAGGSVTKASRLLGFKHHQSLISLINTRHKDLLHTRSTVRKRRRHLFSKPKNANDPIRGKHRDKSQIAILHVEDNEAVKHLVQDVLGAEGMHVDSCVTGTTALELLKGHTRYDVLIVDNELPGLSGLELVLRAKSIAHRRNTPIIMLSGDDIEKEAWRAGVDDFLRKPDAVDELVSRITRVRQKRREKSRTK
jgi:CheY-like chemotaxis protein/tetratricopeptide (TPR) repeat protein